MARLEAIRTGGGGPLDWTRTDAAYTALFREFGLVLDSPGATDAGPWFARRADPAALAAALDHWALARRRALAEADKESWQRIFAAAAIADPDPRRCTVRGLVSRNELEELRRVADDPGQLDVQQAPILVLLAGALTDGGDQARAEQVLRRAGELHPDDFWVNFELGRLLVRANPSLPSEDAVRYTAISVALRPKIAAARVNLGVALGKTTRYDDAIKQFRIALSIDPQNVMAQPTWGWRST